MFGLDEDEQLDAHESRCRELAAMSVSRRLLTAAGRADLARAEIRETDHLTVHYDDRGRARRILRKHRCLRMPRTRSGLERKLRKAMIICERTKR